MPSYQSIKELTRGLNNGAKLLNDMFLKRKTVSVKYDDALETLDGDENRLKHLINFGVIVQSGDLLELDDTYQRFFEDVLSVNEDISIDTVKMYISKLTLGIDSYLAAEPNRKQQFIKDIRHTFKSIGNATRRNVVDLKRNVNITYKQEPNFKIKELRLKDFDDKARLIKGLITETEKIIDRQTIFFATVADFALKQTVSEVRGDLREAAHGLIAISAQIIDYLNRIEYQSVVVKKIRQLKYLKDQFILESNTNVKPYISTINDVWMEKQPKYTTRVSLDFLRNDDSALEILANIRSRLNKKTTLKSRLAGKIDPSYLQENQEQSRTFSHKEIIDGFLAQSADLFTYVRDYKFKTETDTEDRLVLFLQLASQYDYNLRYMPDTKIVDNIEYPIIYPK